MNDKNLVMHKLITDPHKPDDDLRHGCESNGLENEFKNIRHVIAQVPGEADGLDWYWICVMKNGNYGFFTGECDYSGWDCQSWMEYKEDESFDGILKKADIETNKYNSRKPISKQLKDQIMGKQPYAIREE